MSAEKMTSFERESGNNQKRIIRELRRIADALEKLCGVSVHTTKAVTALGEIYTTHTDENETEEE